MISRKFSAWRSRSSDSRPVIRLPRSTAARRRAEAAKNADHSVSSGATRGSSSHTLRGRERVVLARMARPAPDAPAPDAPASDRPAPPAPPDPPDRPDRPAPDGPAPLGMLRAASSAAAARSAPRWAST